MSQTSGEGRRRRGAQILGTVAMVIFLGLGLRFIIMVVADTWRNDEERARQAACEELRQKLQDINPRINVVLVAADKLVADTKILSLEFSSVQDYSAEAQYALKDDKCFSGLDLSGMYRSLANSAKFGMEPGHDAVSRQQYVDEAIVLAGQISKDVRAAPLK